MRKSSLLIILAFALSLNADVNRTVVDLGEVGPSVDIKELDIREVIKKKISMLTMDNIKEKLQDSVDKLAFVKSKMGSCLVDNKREQENIIYLKRDYRDLGGDIIFKKGTAQTHKVPFPSSICVVDGSNIKVARASLSRLLEEGKCNKILVANSDFRELQYEMSEAGIFYPFHKELSEAMGIKCLPSRSLASKSTLQIQEIAMKDLLSEK